ncbi:MAG TPA: hypothetical protein VFG51_00985 [Candidatus Saccharimonadia bacterium]|nr:hypothetical protein [Candidatus Saccharimonadia bacterium]
MALESKTTPAISPAVVGIFTQLRGYLDKVNALCGTATMKEWKVNVNSYDLEPAAPALGLTRNPFDRLARSAAITHDKCIHAMDETTNLIHHLICYHIDCELVTYRLIIEDKITAKDMRIRRQFRHWTAARKLKLQELVAEIDSAGIQALLATPPNRLLDDDSVATPFQRKAKDIEFRRCCLDLLEWIVPLIVDRVHPFITLQLLNDRMKSITTRIRNTPMPVPVDSKRKIQVPTEVHLRSPFAEPTVVPICHPKTRPQLFGGTKEKIHYAATIMKATADAAKKNKTFDQRMGFQADFFPVFASVRAMDQGVRRWDSGILKAQEAGEDISMSRMKVTKADGSEEYQHRTYQDHEYVVPMTRLSGQLIACPVPRTNRKLLPETFVKTFMTDMTLYGVQFSNGVVLVALVMNTINNK